MKRSIHTQLLLIALLAVGSTVTVQAQGVTTSALIHPGSRCDHVIGLILRHGVNNSVDPMAAHSLLQHGPLGSMAIPAAELGDLEIVQINRIAHEDPACGPKVAVTIRNQSCRQVCEFHVTAVAVLGRILPMSPSVTIRVDRIDPGAAIEVVLPLPVEALAMGNRNGQVIGLQTLVVAIDSFDQLVETNEANNLRALDIAQVPALAVAVEEAVEATEAAPVDAPAASQQDAVNSDGQAIAEPASADPLRSAFEQLVPEQTSRVSATEAS